MKFVSLQLRFRRVNPWPKIYVCREEAHEFLLRGLPCALIVRPGDMPEDWQLVLDALLIEEGGHRAMKRGDCHDDFHKDYGDTEISVTEAAARTLGVAWDDVVLLIPIFQRHLKWKATDTPEGVDKAPESTKAMWLLDKNARHATDVLDRTGPPMKLPNGDVIGSCCSACPFNFQNMLGECSFGESTCVERMDFPGKSRLLENLRRWVEHREVMAHKDTQPDLPAFGHGDTPK